MSEWHADHGLVSLVALQRRLHRAIRGATARALKERSTEDLSSVAYDGHGDVVFEIDIPAEHLIVEVFEQTNEPVIVVSEGLGRRVFPASAPVEDCRYLVIVDPIDGSRELMFDKREAFASSAIATARGGDASLSDVVYGLLTELPRRMHQVGVSVEAWKGEGAFEQTWDTASDTVLGPPRRLQPDRTPSVVGGFAPFARCFPGAHEPIGRLADAVYREVLNGKLGIPVVFDDAYIASAAQLYLLASGRYRFIGDLRPLVRSSMSTEAAAAFLCAHPYDVAAAIPIAQEAGAIVTDADGKPLDFPLDNDTDVTFVGYANDDLRAEIEPALRKHLGAIRGGPR